MLVEETQSHYEEMRECLETMRALIALVPLHENTDATHRIAEVLRKYEHYQHSHSEALERLIP